MLPKGPTRQVDGYARLQAFRIEIWDDEKAFQANCQSRRCVNITRDTKLKLKGETDIVLTNMEEGVVEVSRYILLLIKRYAGSCDKGIIIIYYLM